MRDWIDIGTVALVVMGLGFMGALGFLVGRGTADCTEPIIVHWPTGETETFGPADE